MITIHWSFLLAVIATMIFIVRGLATIDDWVPLRTMFYIVLIIITWVVYGGFHWW